MEPKIVYEDEQILVINKPFGVVVNRASSVKGETIQDWVELQVWYLQQVSRDKTNDKSRDMVFRDRSGICHRLDKETSGCLLIAKNPEVMKYYLSLFKDRKIRKTYTALVHGRVEPREGEVVLPLKRSIFDREKWRVRFDGKKAISVWKVVKYFDFESENEQWKNTLSLLEIGLKTGRTHQIRVHFSFLGWPIFSDAKYLNFKQSKIDRQFLWHHFLHAFRLSFVNMDGVTLNIESPLPDDCEQLVKSLKES